jgi:hypothetical protein
MTDFHPRSGLLLRMKRSASLVYLGYVWIPFGLKNKPFDSAIFFFRGRRHFPYPFWPSFR